MSEPTLSPEVEELADRFAKLIGQSLSHEADKQTVGTELLGLLEVGDEDQRAFRVGILIAIAMKIGAQANQLIDTRNRTAANSTANIKGPGWAQRGKKNNAT